MSRGSPEQTVRGEHNGDSAAISQGVQSGGGETERGKSIDQRTRLHSRVGSIALFPVYAVVCNFNNNIYYSANVLHANACRIAVEVSSIKWLSEICDGDARIALNSLQLAIDSLQENCDSHVGLKMMPLSAIQDGIKVTSRTRRPANCPANGYIVFAFLQRSHMMYDQRGDQHYDIISALHKSIRASDDNAALYWCTRMMVSGEDPRYICRRMIRAASEDIGNGNCMRPCWRIESV